MRERPELRFLVLMTFGSIALRALPLPLWAHIAGLLALVLLLLGRSIGVRIIALASPLILIGLAYEYFPLTSDERRGVLLAFFVCFAGFIVLGMVAYARVLLKVGRALMELRQLVATGRASGQLPASAWSGAARPRRWKDRLARRIVGLPGG